MQIIKCNYNDVPNLNKFDLAYINRDPLLDKYILHTPDLNGINSSIETRKKNYPDRKLLVSILKKQNASNNNPIHIKAIEELKSDNCFCITTAHQPCLFGGPLYFVYKIACAINLANHLNKTHSGYNFIPVYYMGSEDHDFEEINNLNLFGKSINWIKNAKGPVGRLDNIGLDEVINQILAYFENSVEKKERLKDLLNINNNEHNYGQIIRDFVYKLFADYPIVVVNPDDVDFKKQMIPVFKDELLNKRSASIISPTLKALESDNFKVQAPGREINLFFMKDNLRERIVFEDDIYKVLNTDLKFNSNEIISELNSHPEHFSPNVILRPVYQETILPSVCFIGGGGEVAYWLELKELFNYYTIPYPVVFRRNSLAWIDPGLLKRINKTALDVKDFIAPLKQVQESFMSKNESLIDLRYQETQIKNIFSDINDQVHKIDASLTGKLAGDETQIVNKIKEWEARLNKALKSKHEITLNQITAIHEKLFPNNSLQERVDSFLPYYAEYGTDYIKTLVNNLNPLEDKFLLIIPD